MMIKIIGIDIDFYKDDEAIKLLVLKDVKTKALKFGDVIDSCETKRGYHLKIRLHRQVSFWRSIEIRYVLQDDVRRMFYDIMRYRAGNPILDVLFDKKSVKYSDQPRTTYERDMK